MALLKYVHQFITPLSDGSTATDVNTSVATSLLSYLPSPITDAMALGGPVSLLLVFMSVIALTIIVYKTIEITRERNRDKRKINQALSLWKNVRYKDAANKLSGSRNGLAHTLWVAMQGSLTSNISNASLREEVVRLASADVERLRTNLKTLENIGTISPLLGLFGTVLGMIEAFRQMELGGSQIDPTVLSGGIWQALLTTGVGLAVAIPTVLAHQWLERRVDAHVHHIEDSTTLVFTANTVRAIEAPSSQGEEIRPQRTHVHAN